MTTKYKMRDDLDFRTRWDTSSSKRQKFPTFIPIIVEYGPLATRCPKIKGERTYQKYLADGDITMGMFMKEIRKRMHLKPSEGLILLVDTPAGGDVMVTMSQTLQQVDVQYRNSDGFLYVFVTLENVFGRDFFSIDDNAKWGTINPTSPSLGN